VKTTSVTDEYMITEIRGSEPRSKNEFRKRPEGANVVTVKIFSVFCISSCLSFSFLQVLDYKVISGCYGKCCPGVSADKLKEHA
jgi:hypothetical protein